MPRQPASVAVGLSGPRLAAALAVMSPASRLLRIAMHAPRLDTWKRPLSRGRLQSGQHRNCRFTELGVVSTPRLRLPTHPATPALVETLRQYVTCRTRRSRGGRRSLADSCVEGQRY